MVTNMDDKFKIRFSPLLYKMMIKEALSPNMNDKEEKDMRENRGCIKSSDDIECRKSLPLFDFAIEFLFPLRRLICLISTRILQEVAFLQSLNGDSFTYNYDLLTIGDLYERLTTFLFPKVAEYIIDQLDCSPYVKSELKDSLRNKDHNQFKSIIHEYDVDYTLASNWCSHITYIYNLLKNISNEIPDMNDSDMLYDTSIQDIYDIKNANIKGWLEITNYLNKEEAENLIGWANRFNNAIVKFEQEGDHLKVFSLSCVSDFLNYISYFCILAEKGLLLSEEIKNIKEFTRKKKERDPIVEVFFSLFTIGNILEDDFTILDGIFSDRQIFDCIESYCTKALAQQQAEKSTHSEYWDSMPCTCEMRDEIIKYFEMEIPKLADEGRKMFNNNIAVNACVLSGYFTLNSACLTTDWARKDYAAALSSLELDCFGDISKEKLKNKIINLINNISKDNRDAKEKVFDEELTAPKKICELETKEKLIAYMVNKLCNSHPKQNKIFKEYEKAVSFYTNRIWTDLEDIAKRYGD